MIDSGCKNAHFYTDFWFLELANAPAGADTMHKPNFRLSKRDNKQLLGAFAVSDVTSSCVCT